MKKLLTVFLCLICMSAPSLAVQPDEVLDDPALEARARALSQDLRCVVCQNENIDSSNAPLARDLRIVVRERLVAGDSDDEVLDYVVARYGEFVLFRPRFEGRNIVLWLTPLLAVLLGAGMLFAFFRNNSDLNKVEPLDAKERAQLRKIMERDEP